MRITIQITNSQATNCLGQEAFLSPHESGVLDFEGILCFCEDSAFGHRANPDEDHFIQIG
jgi:hypothetical protein